MRPGLRDLTIDRLDGPHALHVLDELAELYLEVYAEPPYNSGPLFGEAAFRDRTQRQMRADGFTLVTASAGNGDLVGYAFGVTFAAESWWSGATKLPPPEILSPSKFAVIEVLVRRAWRGRGLGRGLLDDLLADRPEPLAILTAVADAPARRMYDRWGWRQVGTIQHTPTAPVMDELVLPLS